MLGTGHYTHSVGSEHNGGVRSLLKGFQQCCSETLAGGTPAHCQGVALCPWLGEQGLPSKWLVEHKGLSPRTKSGLFTTCVSICIIMKWISSLLMPWGLGQIILLLSFPQIFMGAPTEISPRLMREWRKCGGFIFISIFTFFLVWVTWKSFYIKILSNVICFLGWNSSPALQKCWTNAVLSVVFGQISEFSEKVTKYKSREAFRLVFLIFFFSNWW